VEKKKENKMPFVENNVVKVNFLDFQANIFSLLFKPRTVSLLYRSFGQGGSNSLLLVLI
jgi:hypothetical protein